MPTSTDRFVLTTPSVWKKAMKQRLSASGISRYQFIRKCSDAGICSIHSGECLLADEGTVTGARTPTLQTAIDMAALAGYDLVLVRRGK